MGTITSVMYLLFVAVQMLIVRRIRPQELMQLPLSVAFGWVMDFFVWLFDFQVHSLLWSFVLLAAAISLIALGVILTVSMALAPNPADGFVDAVARALGVEFSRASTFLWTAAPVSELPSQTQ